MNYRCQLVGLGLVLGIVALAVSAEAQTSENLILQQVQRRAQEGRGKVSDHPFSQVNSVSQLSDVNPTDWAFTALQSLVERYGCIAGYPNRTYRGQQPISRFEFATGLTSCLDKINEILASGLADKVSKEDLATAQRLQEEFASELATLRGRLDSLDSKVATLENQQFTTTTKLYGQAVFGLQGIFPHNYDILPRNGIITPIEANRGTNLTFGYNLSLTMITQFDFYGRNILLAGLRAGNISADTPFAINTANFTNLAYEGNTGNFLQLSELSFRNLVTPNFALVIGAAGISPSTIFRGTNPTEGAGQGPLSTFAQRNPILFLGGTNAGVGFDWQIAERISLQGIYAVGNPSVTTGSGGLFGGTYTMGLHLNLEPANNLVTSIYYLHSYTDTGNTFLTVGDSTISVFGGLFNTNAVGATLDWRFAPKVSLGTWGGYTNSYGTGTVRGTVETTNWMVYVNFYDLFGRGNLGGIYVGQPPKIVSSNLNFGNVPAVLSGMVPTTAGGQPATTTHVELFYRYRIADNISLTPGIIFLFNPSHTATDTITIGAVRTTFTF